MQHGRTIKSLQRATIAIPASSSANTATLSPAVNVARTRLRYLGCSVDDLEVANAAMARVDLTNGTTVTARRGAAGASTICTVSFEITEGY